jgi:hypothetical protein
MLCVNPELDCVHRLLQVSSSHHGSIDSPSPLTSISLSRCVLSSYALSYRLGYSAEQITYGTMEMYLGARQDYGFRSPSKANQCNLGELMEVSSSGCKRTCMTPSATWGHEGSPMQWWRSRW